jgi:hypothetical protein
MSAVIKWSVILVVLVTLMNLISVGMGLHTNPLIGMLFIGLALLFNIAAVILLLRETRAGSGYGKQFLNSTLLGLIAGVLIFATSFLVLSVLFPDAIPEMIEGQVAFLESAPIPEETKQAQIAAVQQTTATAQAMAGLMGTFLTSLVVGAILAIFLRKK